MKLFFCRSIVFLFAVITAVAVPTQAATEKPIDIYRSDTSGGMKLCEMTYELAILRGTVTSPMDTQDDAAGCVQKLLAQGAASYQQAAKSIRPKTAVEKLKNYHAIWVSAVRGISAAANETKAGYGQRRELAWSRLDEAWTLVELEIK